MNPVKIVIDVVGGGALVFVLLVVLVVDLLTRGPSAGPVAKNDLIVKDITNIRQSKEQKKLRLAVLTDPVFDGKQIVVWDDMSKLLDRLGQGYDHDKLRTKDLENDPTKLDNYDVLFFTCSDDKKKFTLRDQLVKFVSRGGVLYASDWRYDAIKNAFPDMVDQSKEGEGLNGEVTAEVVDPGLRKLLGPTAHLHFDLPQWKTAAFGGPRVTVLMQGQYRRLDKSLASAPLLVKFPFGDKGGQVIFTSFHNEKETSELAEKLLKYLVFALVTAQVDAEVQENMKQGGFAAPPGNVLSTPKDNPSVTDKFQVQKKGSLVVALGFRDEGATLKLYIKAPDGRDWSKEVTSTVVLEVPDAPAGEWTYTVTAIRRPYENFPFTVTIGEKK
jgi:hypothetical protein